MILDSDSDALPEDLQPELGLVVARSGTNMAIDMSWIPSSAISAVRSWVACRGA